MEGNNPLTAHEVLCVPYISSRAIGELLFAVDEFLSEYVKIFEGRPEPASVVAMRLRMEVEKLTPREVLIVEHRVLSRPRKTLKEIAARCGVSCERIRQIQTGTERRIRTACGHELRFLAGALHNELAPSAEQSALHRPNRWPPPQRRRPDRRTRHYAVPPSTARRDGAHAEGPVGPSTPMDVTSGGMLSETDVSAISIAVASIPESDKRTHQIRESLRSTSSARRIRAAKANR